MPDIQRFHTNARMSQIVIANGIVHLAGQVPDIDFKSITEQTNNILARIDTLLAEAGVEYVCDWVNDDLPYAMRTRAGALHAMPHPVDMDDYPILVQNHHTEDDFRDALIDQFDMLYRESSPESGHVMAISLHPWVIGQPYRIGALEEALDHMLQHAGVWSATGSQILSAWRAAQP